MKVRVVCRKVYDYIRYDLREIAFPSSLPDPPHIQNRPKLTWRDNLFILKKATRLYCASWVRDIGPDLRPNDYTKDNEANGEAKTTSSAPEKEPSVIEDLAVAARGGMETLRPALQRVYLTRASAYRDALQSFIQGHEHNPWSFATTSLLKSCNPSERMHTKLMECMEELGMSWKMTESNISYSVEITRPEINFMTDKETDSFNKALESVEGALLCFSREKMKVVDRSKSKFQGLWNFLVYSPTMKPGPDVAVVDASVCPPFTICLQAIIWFWKHYISQFEMPRQKDIKVTDDDANYHDEAASSQLIHVPRNENIIRKSIAKLEKKSKDVLQGTQLLAIDVAASMGLLKRLLIGDELTEKERKTLRRTMMDLASVVRIGALMLLPGMQETRSWKLDVI
ncbi:EMBRYO DEFECTIVE 2735 [Salix purpurea]|uniref:EMBRYO DEFECTIVE 2735 n=1 Tax=Salix purpurea TaxID=77065 RepID=A0A9Q0VXC7_SALPP|nr:EMBRYO DEFECTIVE 2735 [Salix purpurea]